MYRTVRNLGTYRLTAQVAVSKLEQFTGDV